MSELRWIDPESNAPDRTKAALAALDAEPSREARQRGWARFREAQDRRETSGRRGFVLAAGGLAAVAVASLMVISLDAKGPGLPSEDHALAPEPEVERTEGEAWKRLETPTGDVIRVHPRAVLEVRHIPSVRIELSSGLVDVEAAPRGAKDALEVIAHPWKVTVVGTRFTVERQLHQGLKVEVQEGRVRVVGPGHDQYLDPGDTFEARPLELPKKNPAQSPAQPMRAPSRRTTRSPAGSASRPGSAPRMGTTSRGGSASRPGSASGPGTAPPSLPESAQPAASPESEQAAWISKARDAQTLEARVAALDRAAALEAPLAEIAAYRAAAALYEAERFKAAEARYAAVLARWPAGELGEMAHLDRIDCLISMGQALRARAAVRRYLRAFPEGAERSELQFSRAEIARSLGEYSVAAEKYAQSAQAARFSDSATFLEALSHALAGDIPSARSKMESYLLRFPQGRHAVQARKSLREDGD